MCILCEKLYVNEDFYRAISPMIFGFEYRSFLYEKDESRDRMFIYFCKVYTSFLDQLHKEEWWDAETMDNVTPCVILRTEVY